MPVQLRDESGITSSARYENLDLFRVVGIYGIVLLHFYEMSGPAPSLDWLIRLRDCTFAFIVTSSFFVLTKSFMGKPDKSFKTFLLKRFTRILVPFFIWTTLYWFFWSVFHPITRGRAVEWPPPFLLLSGYMHLWYLQFIFLSSLAVYPLLHCLGRRNRRRWQVPFLCFAAALTYALLFREPLQEYMHTRLASHDESMRLFAFQSITYLLYVPLAVGIAFLADGIAALYRQRVFRILSLLVVVVSMGIHLGSPTARFTREVYSLSVFVALLQPFPKFLGKDLWRLVKYTYAIYILHYFTSHALAAVLDRAGVESTGGVIIAGSLFVFSLSLVSTVLLRKVFPWDWFLPLIPVSNKSQHLMPSRDGSGPVRVDTREIVAT